MDAIDCLPDRDGLRDRAYRLAPQLRAEAIDQVFASIHALLRAAWVHARHPLTTSPRRSSKRASAVAACH